MQRSSSLTIDLNVIRKNLKALTTSNHVMVMVKGNAYGTDPVMLSKFIQKYTLPKIPFLGVSHVWEAIQLREAGVHLPIFVISVPPEMAESVVHYQLIAAISSFEEATALNQAAKQTGIPIATHLFLNTGTNRFGIPIETALKLYQHIHKAEYLTLEGVMTHFAATKEEALDPFSYEQIGKFKQFVDTLPMRPRWIHAASSSGAARFSLPFCNLTRIGLAVVGYGICPENVQPALKLTTSLSTITPCKKGESVGYNCTFNMQRDKGRVGVIPYGYFDGYPRSSSGKGYVLIRGKKAPMIGTICMDFTLIDLTDIPEAQVGDQVTLFDSSLSPEMLAEWSQTDVREILARISPRVKRIWINPLLMEKKDENRRSERLPSPLLSI